MRVRRLLLVSLGLFVSSGIVSWFLLGKPWFIPASFAVKQLESVLPGLEQAQITAYRNQNWCKNIAYSKGNFSETTQPTTCNLFEGEATVFDETANVAFSNLRQTLLFTGVNISFLNAYYEEGKVRQVEFNLNCWLCSRTRYVYEPNHVLPEDIGSEMWFDAINETWYRVNEDWN
jgi:hypothetical protein